MNQLLHQLEFEQILASYRPSEETLQAARDLRIIMLVGVSSSGRNTVIRELIGRGGYHEFVTDTTRQPRTNDGVSETQGKEYYFRSEEDFLARLKEGKYLEAAIIHDQQVSGTSIEELLASHQQQSIAIGDFENKGARSLLELGINAQAYFLIPPSFDVWMQRLTSRGILDQEEIRRRLISAEKQLQEALEEPRFTIIVNDQLEATVDRLDQMIKGETSPPDDRTQTYDSAWRLLNDLKQHISS